MKSTFIKTVMLSVIVILLAAQIGAQTKTDIRGQVVYYNSQYGNYCPSQGTRVDLLFYNSASKQWSRIATALTDSQGMYYFYKITPGKYTLQVKGTKNYPITVTPVDSHTQFQEIAIIKI
jgi:hypothetical protein